MLLADRDATRRRRDSDQRSHGDGHNSPRHANHHPRPTDANSDSYAYSVGNVHADAYSVGNVHVYSCAAQQHADRAAHQHIDCTAHRHADRDGPSAHINTHAHVVADIDVHANTNGYGYGQTIYPDRDRHTIGGA